MMDKHKIIWDIVALILLLSIDLLLLPVIIAYVKIAGLLSFFGIGALTFFELVHLIPLILYLQVNYRGKNK